jgi:hypothetical protein
MLNKWQARYMRDLQPFVGSMTLAHRKIALNEVDPLSRRPDFVPLCHISIIMGWRGSVRYRFTTEVRAAVRRREVKSTNVNALRLSLEFDYLVREGYSRDSLYEDEGEWARESRIEVRARYFSRLDRLCVPRNSELRMRLNSELYDISSSCHKGVASNLAEALA